MRETLFVELLGGVGDVLISLPPIQALARTYPEARLTVLTLSPGGELLEIDPFIHEAPRVVANLWRTPSPEERVGERACVWPRGTLCELAATLSCADLAVGADTGSAHVATTLGVPTVTLFGPSGHGRYGQPYPHTNLQGHPGCPQRDVSDFITQQPCWYAGACTLENRPWHSCLEDVSGEDVSAAVGPYLEDRSDAERAVHGAGFHGGVR